MPTEVEPTVHPISERRVLKGGLIVAGGLFAAQLAGFARQATLGYLMGTGAAADALSAAMAPMELWWSVLALAVIFGFTPRLSPSGAMGGRSFQEILKPVARLAVGSSLVFLVFANPIVLLFAPGLDSETARLAAGLMRIIGLAPAAVGCSFAYSALLYSRRRFVIPSLHNATVNMATISGALLLHERIGVYGFAAGYAAGAWLQLLWAVLYARRLPESREPAPRGAGEGIELWALLAGPAPIMGQALAMELTTAVSRAYASTFGPGMTAAFDYGFKLFRVPLALLVVPLSQSLLPEIASLQSSPEERRGAARAMQRAAILTASVCALMMAPLMIWREPLVELLFQRGQFGAASTAAVATVLLGYMPVIIGRGVVDLLSRTLFGMGVYRVPLLAASLALAINAAVCALLPSVEPALIGLGAAIGFIAGAIVIVSHVRKLAADG